MPDMPPQLEDSLARIDQARENYKFLQREINKFLYKYVEGMEKGFNPNTGNFRIRLRHPKDRNINRRARVLISQIVENLRTALDYMVYQLSLLTEPNLDEREPQFIIADTEASFERQAKRRLRYLTNEQRSFLEQIQPYHGNGLLSLLGEIANAGKHRGLVSIRDQTGFDIYFNEMKKRKEYKGCFVYPMEKGQAIFAKPRGPGSLVLMESYDAMSTLKNMIEHVSDVIGKSYCFFEGRPLEMRVVRD